jgi:hypothetical protein
VDVLRVYAWQVFMWCGGGGTTGAADSVVWGALGSCHKLLSLLSMWFQQAGAWLLLLRFIGHPQQGRCLCVVGEGRRQWGNAHQVELGG